MWCPHHTDFSNQSRRPVLDVASYYMVFWINILTNSGRKSGRDLKIKKVAGELKNLQSITTKIQEDSITLFDIHTLFERVPKDYPVTEHEVGVKENTTHNASFELGIVHSIQGKTLTENEQLALSVFTYSNAVADQENYVDFATSIIASKLAKLTMRLEWVPGTSNVCERLFSRAKFIFTDYRKSLEPVHLEAQMFLFANRRFWRPTLINEFV